MLEMLDTIEALLEEVEKGGGEEAMARLRKRDKLPIRERIALALDRDSPFLEISPLAVALQFHRRLGVYRRHRRHLRSRMFGTRTRPFGAGRRV